jgi:hypothetical protein
MERQMTPYKMRKDAAAQLKRNGQYISVVFKDAKVICSACNIPHSREWYPTYRWYLKNKCVKMEIVEQYFATL